MRAAAESIEVDVDLELHEWPERTVVRVRHPQGKPMRRVMVNGAVHRAFDADKGDISELPAAAKLEIQATY